MGKDLTRRCLLLLAVCLPSAVLAAPWRLEPETRVSVDVTWQGSVIEVRFPRLSGRIDFDEVRPETAKARITAYSADATTGVGVVDALVRGSDYLDTAAHPTIVFDLDRLTRTSSQTADVEGRLTLRGVTRPVRFAARVTRYEEAADGFVAGFDIEGVVDRTQFGSTGGLPDVPAELGVRIHLAMRSG